MEPALKPEQIALDQTFQVGNGIVRYQLRPEGTTDITIGLKHTRTSNREVTFCGIPDTLAANLAETYFLPRPHASLRQKRRIFSPRLRRERSPEDKTSSGHKESPKVPVPPLDIKELTAVRRSLLESAKHIESNITDRERQIFIKGIGAPKQQKPSMDRVQIKGVKILEGQKPELDWYHIKNYNAEFIDEIAAFTKISDGTVEQILEKDSFPSTHSSGDIRFVAIEELHVKNGKGTTTDILALLGNGYLITLSRGDSEAINRVAHEARTGRLRDEELKSSNHLYCRILGATTYINADTIEGLTKTVDVFAKHESTLSRTNIAYSYLTRLRDTKELFLKSYKALSAVPAALRERRSWYGASAAKESLTRYESTNARLEVDLDALTEKMLNIETAWDGTHNVSKTRRDAFFGGATALLLFPGVMLAYLQVATTSFNVTNEMAQAYFHWSVALGVLSFLSVSFSPLRRFREMKQRNKFKYNSEETMPDQEGILSGAPSKREPDYSISFA